MKAQRFSDYAIPIRMTCMNPETAGRNARPVIVSFREEATVCDHARVSVCCAEGASPDDVGRAVAKAIRQSGTLPESVAVEKLGLFRLQAADRSARLRLPACATIVTGSAQGFGRGIAEELAQEGARIVVADLNVPLGEAFTAELNARHGKDTAIFVETNVTEAASIETCANACVAAFGGIDLFVSNAGVLRAGGLDELDEASFDLVTRTNYTAYFLCVRTVAAIMKRQHAVNPTHVMDIIQINSKSGLEGSNRNFAYAGGKFGGIGLTQSFALELVGFNIKVNAICPGNYFDGPLWSDPDRGLFVQYLKAGKVPGARTIDDVKASYLSKVPMKRGCLPADVARAIIYAREQSYETGQAIPVTGGQVMLN